MLLHSNGLKNCFKSYKKNPSLVNERHKIKYQIASELKKKADKLFRTKFPEPQIVLVKSQNGNAL